MEGDQQTKSVVASSQNSGTAVKTEPDKATLERIENLAAVGTALFQNVASDNTFGTNYFLATEALTKFKEGIDMLNLPPNLKEGMDNLIKYLGKKIEKRAKYSDNQNEKPLV